MVTYLTMILDPIKKSNFMIYYLTMTYTTQTLMKV